MQVTFIGGAQRIGSSCVAIRLAGQWIVVDAGVSVDRRSDPLPDLAFLQDKDVRAIFVTHAHADHIGALPLLHQAFPTVPIYASRATALLMEVMLADALAIMEKRAAEELEFPLYPKALIGGMLSQVRPLPVGTTFSVPELADVSIATSRAGHIAGAVSLGFVAPDGSLVVSGDISMTAQHTILGAEPPHVKQPDLLVLESTYGARLHANRQGEELRLAQAVAAGIAQGGHVLIPAFGLGRGQEVLLILRQAQEKGQVPRFPIYVDGLIRRVCSTYMLVPESLTPALQRQIRKGYAPFTSGSITFVRDERQREKILAGPPACIISSSGMLTGGPSAWYAERLLERQDASILITGYQDEEAPGRRLLDLVEKQEATLEINGSNIPVRCHVSKYHLSAHADGSELAAYVAFVRPKRVALVHGDDESRAALRASLAQVEVVLPLNGQTLEVQQRKHAAGAKKAVQQAKALPVGIGEGRPFTGVEIRRLWQAVQDVPGLRIVTARELALAWYGEADERGIGEVMETLQEDWGQQYFVAQDALAEAYRVRGQSDEALEDIQSDLVNKLLFVQVFQSSAKPVLCSEILLGAAIRVMQLRGTSALERGRYPFSAILDVLGPCPPEWEDQQPGVALAELVKTARKIRRSLSARQLAEVCQEGALYALGDLCHLAGVSARTIEERLAVAKLVYQHPQLFVQQTSVLSEEGMALYRLAPDWQEGLLYPEQQDLPDQNEILRTIEQAIGDPPDLYRRSVNPATGDVVLHFYFPDAARGTYGEMLERAAELAGVSIEISPNPHQEQLRIVALQSLPDGVVSDGRASLHFDRHEIVLRCRGRSSREEMQQVQERFSETTGWMLRMEGDLLPIESNGEKESSQNASKQERQGLSPHAALSVANQYFLPLTGCYKVGTEDATRTILARFHFPGIANQRYQAIFKVVEAETGWSIRIHPHPHQGAMAGLALQLMPSSLSCIGTPSLNPERQIVVVACQGSASSEEISEAQRQFKEQSGWHLEFKGLN